MITKVIPMLMTPMTEAKRRIVRVLSMLAKLSPAVPTPTANKMARATTRPRLRPKALPRMEAIGPLSGSVAIAAYFSFPASAMSTMVFAAVMGSLWLGVVPLVNGLVAQLFGLRFMATLTGIAFLSHQVGSFVGVWLGGYVYDLTGAYDLVWYLGILLGLASAAVHIPINERSDANFALKLA